MDLADFYAALDAGTLCQLAEKGGYVKPQIVARWPWVGPKSRTLDPYRGRVTLHKEYMLFGLFLEPHFGTEWWSDPESLDKKVLSNRPTSQQGLYSPSIVSRLPQTPSRSPSNNDSSNNHILTT